MMNTYLIRLVSLAKKTANVVKWILVFIGSAAIGLFVGQSLAMGLMALLYKFDMIEGFARLLDAITLRLP